MSGAIRDETRIGETSATSWSFVVSSSQRGIGDGGFRRKRPEAKREIGCHRFAPENRRSVNRIYGPMFMSNKRARCIPTYSQQTPADQQVMFTIHFRSIRVALFIYFMT